MSFDSIYYCNDVEQKDDSPKMGEEDVSNFQMLLDICPGLEQALKAFEGDTSLVKCFVGHMSKCRYSSCHIYAKLFASAVDSSKEFTSRRH